MARLEEKVDSLEQGMKNLEGKMDELLTLKNKGMGAFWLASAIVGSGLIGLILSVVNYLKGH